MGIITTLLYPLDYITKGSYIVVENEGISDIDSRWVHGEPIMLTFSSDTDQRKKFALAQCKCALKRIQLLFILIEIIVILSSGFLHYARQIFLRTIETKYWVKFYFFLVDNGITNFFFSGNTRRMDMQ